MRAVIWVLKLKKFTDQLICFRERHRGVSLHSQYFPEGHPDIDTDEPVIEYLESSAPAGSEAEYEEADAEAEETISVSAIKRMKKAELIEFAEANGIEIDPKATNAAMIETILEAL